MTLVVHPRAVVTGAGSGLGRAFCIELSRRGARVVGADVRSVAAARMLAEGRSLAPTAIVVRRGPGRSLPEQVVARTLGAPSLGQVGHHRALPRLAELGLLPVAGPARGFARQIAPILTGLTGA